MGDSPKNTSSRNIAKRTLSLFLEIFLEKWIRG